MNHHWERYGQTKCSFYCSQMKKKKNHNIKHWFFLQPYDKVLIPLNLVSLFVIQDWFYQLYTSPEVIGESNKIKTSEKSLNIVWAQ